MKVMKTLKFWSKKKKKRINNIHHHPPPPCCCSHQHLQPSAPPLPSWLEYEEQTYNQPLSGLPVSFDPQEHERVVNPSSSSPLGDVETYQQYMVENPVYGVPVLPSRETERSAGAVGCVFSIGDRLFRCFFPCFHFRDAQKNSSF